MIPPLSVLGKQDYHFFGKTNWGWEYLVCQIPKKSWIVVIVIAGFLKMFPFFFPQMSSLPKNLSWTKLFWEKSGWRGEEGDALLEGLARNVFKEFYNTVKLW